MKQPIRIAIIGLGKIAHEQHLPAIHKSAHFKFVFAVDPHPKGNVSVPVFASIDDALSSGIGFEAVAICTPPQVRFSIVQRLVGTGCALLLEKPPALSMREAQALSHMAGAEGAVIFAAWHSRFASQIAAARAWAGANQIVSGDIQWRENAAKWHPGQDWLWKPGGFGVFDPGINALSILTALFPQHWRVADPIVRFSVGSDTPVAADFKLLSGEVEITASFEFHDSDEEKWTICLTGSNAETFELSEGGASLSQNGRHVSHITPTEYDGIYEHFALLIGMRQSDFDTSPLSIVESILDKAAHLSVWPAKLQRPR